MSYIVAIAARWTKSLKFTLSIAVHRGGLAKNHFWLVATQKKRIGEQLNYFWNMCPKLFSWAKNKRKLFSDGKSRGPLLARVALNNTETYNISDVDMKFHSVNPQLCGLNDSFKWSLITWALSERYVDSFVNNSYEYLANFSHYPPDNVTDWPTNSWFDKMNFDNTELPCYRKANKVHLLPCYTLPPTVIITYAVKFVS